MLVVYESSQLEFAKLIKFPTKQVELLNFKNKEIITNNQKIVSDKILVIFPKLVDIHNNIFEFLSMLSKCESDNIISFIPYIPYSRQDVSLEFKIVQDLILKHCSKIVTIDAHNSNSIDNRIINILPYNVCGYWFKNKEDLLVVAPDVGATERARDFAKNLGCDFIVIDKITKQSSNIEKSKNRHCVIVDDIIDTGKTVIAAIELLNVYKPKRISICISHNFFKCNSLNIISANVRDIANFINTSNIF